MQLKNAQAERNDAMHARSREDIIYVVFCVLLLLNHLNLEGR